MLTDEEQRSRERVRAAALVPPGHVQCRGWPFDHYCVVLVPALSGRTLCYGCSDARLTEQRTTWHQSASMPSVGEVLGDLPPVEQFTACYCGGDVAAPEHELSLLHLRAVNGR